MKPGHVHSRIFFPPVLLILSSLNLSSFAEGNQAAAIDNYRQFISRAETSHGPDNRILSEPLISLGLALKNTGNYADANDAFKRAQQIIRVNGGLYNLNQIPVLEQLIETDAARYNWEGVNRAYHQIFWLYQRAYPESDPRLLDVIDNQIRWRLAAINYSNGEDSANHLIKVKELSDTAVEMSEKQFGTADPRFIQRLYKRALAGFYIAIAVQRGGDTGNELVNSLAFHQARFGYMKSSEWLVDSIFREGMDIFRRISKLYNGSSDEQKEQQAMLLLYMADWNLLFNKRDHAMRMYNDACERLVHSGVTRDELNQYFSRPVILPVERFVPKFDKSREFLADLLLKDNEKVTPDNVLYTGNRDFYGWSKTLPGVSLPHNGILEFVPRDDEPRALAVFDVEDTGWARNIKIIQYRPDTFVNRNRAYNTVWAIQFRPRIIDGRAALATGLTMNLIVPD